MQCGWADRVCNEYHYRISQLEHRGRKCMLGAVVREAGGQSTRGSVVKGVGGGGQSRGSVVKGAGGGGGGQSRGSVVKGGGDKVLEGLW